LYLKFDELTISFRFNVWRDEVEQLFDCLLSPDNVHCIGDKELLFVLFLFQQHNFGF
jgi:hypothetical protein